MGALASSTMVIVGGSRGIGLAAAAYFASRVARLICISRSPSPHGRWLKADVADAFELDKAIAELSAEHIDALLYLGGTWEAGAFTDAYDFQTSPRTEIDRVLAVNLAAPIKLVHDLAPALRRSDAPRMLVIGSLSGLDNTATREVANSASKYGLRGAAQAMRHALPWLATTVINPGNVATPEVEADIARGAFDAQTPIPMADLLATIEYALTLSPASVAAEINLAQMRPG